MRRVTGKELIVGAAVIVGALGTIVLQGPQIWQRIGWMPPAAHAADVVLTRDEVVAMVAALEGDIGNKLDLILDRQIENQTEWKCDEWAEELEELEEQRGPSGDDRRRIDELKDILLRNECSRFVE